MRVFNQDSLRSDIEQYFGLVRLDPANLKFLEWMDKAWTKHFLKNCADGFLYPIVPHRMPSFFKDEDGGKPEESLIVELPFGELKLVAQSQWDEKDAEKGILFYYSPGAYTIAKFTNEVSDVRDYVRSVIEENPNVDLGRRSWADVVRASEVWHEEQRRQMQAMMEAAAAVAKAQNQTVWESLQMGVDHWPASDYPMVINGQTFILMRLASQRALNYESFVLDHCVHSYGADLMNGETVLLSVRSASSLETPLITVEIRVPREGGFPNLVQIRGIHNHDAEQTVRGITAAVQQEVFRLPRKGRDPLVPGQNGDLSFRLDMTGS